jgi:hypothetical protein
MRINDLVMELGPNLISDVWIDLKDSEKLSSARNAFGLFSFRSVWSQSNSEAPQRSKSRSSITIGGKSWKASGKVLKVSSTEAVVPGWRTVSHTLVREGPNE